MRSVRRKRQNTFPVKADAPKAVVKSFRRFDLAEVEPPKSFPTSRIIPTDDLPVETEFQGSSLRVDYGVVQGMDGTPTSRGWITLEKNPSIVPLKARGILTDPGVFYTLAQNSPEVSAALDGPTNAVVSAPFRVEAPPLPPWAGPEDELARDRQLEFCQRVFYRWTPNRFKQYLREVFRTAPVQGFYTGEITAELVNDGERDWLMPNLPQIRQTWNVWEWIHQEGNLRGIWYRYFGTDSFGVSGVDGETSVKIPIEKLLYIGAGRVGSNWEGVSWLRPVWMHIKMLQKCLQLWALACEVNGLGILVAYSPSAGQAIANDYNDIMDEFAGNTAAEDVPYIVLPPGVDLKHISPGQQIPDMTPLIIILERMIAKALKNSHSLIALQKAGSFAARSDASSEARDGWKFIAEEFISGPIEEQIFRRFIEINFPEDAEAGRIYPPELRVADTSVKDPTAVVETTAKAMESGLLDHPEFGEHFREILGLPRAKEVPADDVNTLPVTEEGLENA